MATHKSDIIAAKESTSYAAKTLASAPKVGALKLEDYPIYTMKGTEVGGDIIELTELPAGSALIPQRAFAAFGAPRPFESGRISLGTPENPNLFGYADLTFDGKISATFGYKADYGQFPEVLISDKPQKVVARFDGTPANRAVNGKLFFGLEYRIRG